MENSEIFLYFRVAYVVLALAFMFLASQAAGKLVRSIIVINRGESMRVSSAIRALANSIQHDAITEQADRKDIEQAVSAAIARSQTSAKLLVLYLLCEYVLISQAGNIIF